MRVLITGGAGFIGSHLADALCARGDKVTVLDNLSTGSVANVSQLAATDGFQHVVGSVTDRSLMAELIEQVDLIIHLAAAVGVRLIVASPVYTIETNVKGTEVVLEAASRRKIPVFLASTSEVYGKTTHIPFREDDDLVLGPPTKGRWSYAASKLLDEFLAMAYWKEKDLPIIIGRFFNTVGRRQTGRYGMVLPTFARQATSGEPITVHGSGRQSRCFSYVGDVVSAVLGLVERTEAVGQIYNIGSREEIAVEELAMRVKNLTGSNSPIRHIPYDQVYDEGFEDMQRRVPCIDKIMSLTGWHPTTTVDQMILEVAQDVMIRGGEAEVSYGLSISPVVNAASPAD